MQAVKNIEVELPDALINTFASMSAPNIALITGKKDTRRVGKHLQYSTMGSDFRVLKMLRTFSLSEHYLEQRRKMLRNYPLPEGWTEIYDPGMRRHYYWNQNTDEVKKYP
jgi:hypothetical protein